MTTPRTFEEALEKLYPDGCSPHQFHAALHMWEAALASLGEPVAWMEPEGDAIPSRTKRLMPTINSYYTIPLYRKPGTEGGK